MSSDRTLLPLSEATRPFYAGIDLGGTNIKAAILDDLGRIVEFHTEPTHAARGPEDAAARMGRAVHTLAGRAGIATTDVARVGLGSPGPLDIPAGTIVRAGNLPGWDDFPLRDRVAAHAGCEVTFANDANAAGYGEYWVGSARGSSSLVLLTLGTGVGGGIIIGDLNVEGAHSHGSECGHIIVDPAPTARVCPCGQPGHLEAYTSATSLKALAAEALAAGGTGSLAAAVAAGEALTPVVIAREAGAGDALAMGVLMEAARWLGIGIVTFMHTIDPEAVVIGGAMTFGREEHPVGRAFLERVREEVCRRTFPVLARRTSIRYASLGGDAGSIGAAGLARLDHRRQS
ncbi:MAG: ROK family protein [Planctomycetota bacterium]|jgi:glucokinase|nr:MAG: ROK family protein [Planctomycetota bacterium]